MDCNDFYPEALRDEINAVNADVYDNVNNGEASRTSLRSRRSRKKPDGDQASADLAIRRTDVHDKNARMLQSHLE